jgi:hypothetical protein
MEGVHLCCASGHITAATPSCSLYTMKFLITLAVLKLVQKFLIELLMTAGLSVSLGLWALNWPILKEMAQSETA